MKKYELIHEIQDMCHGKTNSSISEVEADCLDDYMKEHTSRAAVLEKTVLENGAVTYDVMTNGIKEKFTFSEI